MKSISSRIALALLLAVPAAALADTGPQSNPLRVVQMYTGDASDRIYVRFNSGAMPGCYADSAGRLFIDDVFFKAVYSQILMLMAVDGIKGSVVFENQGGPGWSVCKILGLDLRP